MFTPQHLVDLPAVFEGMPPEQQSICNAFNSTVRDLSWRGLEPTPMVLHDALDMTFTQFRGQFDRHEIMTALVAGGFSAPRGYLPPDLGMYGYGADEVLSRAASPFARALRGITDLFYGHQRPGPAIGNAFGACRPAG